MGVGKEQFAYDVSPLLFQSVAELLGNTTIVMLVPQSNKHGEVLPFETDFAEGQKSILPMWRHLSMGHKLDGKNKTLTVLHLSDVHTLDTDGLSPQLVGYLFCHSLAAVVNDNDRLMFHIIILFEYRVKGEVMSHDRLPR